MDEDAEDTQQSSVDNYTGISIKVRILPSAEFLFLTSRKGFFQFKS